MKPKLMPVVAALGAFLVSGVAAADPVRLAQRARLLPAYEIRTIVRSMGLDPIGRAMRRGRHYVMRAIDYDGREVRVLVDARYGEIISVAPVMAPPPYRSGPRRAFPPGARIVTVPPPDYRRPPAIYGVPDIYYDEPPLRPPRIVRRSRSAPATKRNHPPLPRPRPAEASLASKTDTAPAAEKTPAAAAAPEVAKPDVKVPAVAPLDPDSHGPIAN